MALSRLTADKTEIVRRTTDGDFDFVEEWGAQFGVANAMSAFRAVRDYLNPKKDFDALQARVDALRSKYTPLEEDDFNSIAARNFDQKDVVDAMGEEASSFNRRHTRRFMKDGGRVQVFPSSNGYFTRLITDRRESPAPAEEPAANGHAEEE